MRAIVAKRIRRHVYGKGHHPGLTTYAWGTPFSAKLSKKKWVQKALGAQVGICLISDTERLRYQQAKKEYNQNKRLNR